MESLRDHPPSPQYNVSLLNAHGENVFVSANVEIRRPHLVSIGNHVAIDSGLYLTTGAQIGNYVHIGPSVKIIGGRQGLLQMGDFTNIAVGSKIICVSDTFRGDGLVTAPGIPLEYTKLIIAPIVFEDFANVGANVTIMPGVTLREGTAIGACSLVTKSTEPWTIYVGIPARPVRMRPKDIMIAHAKRLGYHKNS
ncbi:MAG: acyltransferase [Candidatus Sungbacteria bacterium]|nr:acyltransferase [Candidatus Sungbacteria bacterium]